jgi:FkbM family methyltransferase
MKTISYYFSFFLSRNFRREPIVILLRALDLLIHILLQKKKKIQISFGEYLFRFNFVPLGRNMGGRGIFLFREKIEPLMEYGHKLIERGDTVIDGGANQGIYSLAFASAVGDKGRVIAVEPFSYCVELIRQNANLNNLKNVKVYDSVLSSKSEVRQIDFTNGVGKASIVRDFGGSLIEKHNGITLSDLADAELLSCVNLVKLDIEGAEFEVIKAARGFLKKFCPKLVIEVDIESFDQINKELKSIGYHPYIFELDGSLQKISRITKNQDNIFFLRDEHLPL